jgi:hypothetical protein
MQAHFYPGVLFIQGRSESVPISDDEPTMQGEECPSVMPNDEETDAKMCGDIMKLGNGIRCSPCPRTKPQKWGKLPTNKYTEKDTTPVAAIADMLRSKS